MVLLPGAKPGHVRKGMSIRKARQPLRGCFYKLCRNASCGISCMWRLTGVLWPMAAILPHCELEWWLGRVRGNERPQGLSAPFA